MHNHDSDNLMDDLFEDDAPLDSPATDDDDVMPDLVQLDLPEEAGKVLTELQAELDEAVAARQRALADFRNFQRRAIDNEKRALEQGAMRVIRSLLPVLDNFDLVLEQDTEQATAEQIVGGVRIVRDELIKTLETNGASRINPKRGDAFNPNRHQAMLHQDDAEIEPNHIVAVLQPGYALGDMVIRPAKVSITPEVAAAAADEASEASAGDLDADTDELPFRTEDRGE